MLLAIPRDFNGSNLNKYDRHIKHFNAIIGAFIVDTLPTYMQNLFAIRIERMISLYAKISLFWSVENRKYHRCTNDNNDIKSAIFREGK